jgi:LysR family transcriptional regulator, carnitine catabolism transcriptional activator
MDFTSRQLRAFLLVARHRSFTRAAEALFITPSGLSLLIRELETQLGPRLFDRTTRQVALTTHGNHLLPVAKRSLEELDSAMSHIGKTAQEASQSLSIGAPPLVAANILPQAIKEFRVHRPELRIQLSDGTLTAILEGVQAGKLDLGLGIFGKAPDIRRTPFFRFSLMVIRPDADPTLRRASTTWSALKRERLLVMTNTSPLQQFINKHLAKAGVVPQANTLIGSLDLQIAMVEAGEGVAVIPSFGLPACRNRRVMMSRLINPEVTLDFYQIRNRGKKLPSGAEDFTSFLQAYIARWAGRAGIL